MLAFSNNNRFVDFRGHLPRRFFGSFPQGDIGFAYAVHALEQHAVIIIGIVISKFLKISQLVRQAFLQLSNGFILFYRLGIGLLHRFLHVGREGFFRRGQGKYIRRKYGHQQQNRQFFHKSSFEINFLHFQFKKYEMHKQGP